MAELAGSDEILQFHWRFSNLRSWASNNEKLRGIARAEKVIDEDNRTKVLGMRWDSEKDTINIFTEKLCSLPNRPHDEERIIETVIFYIRSPRNTESTYCKRQTTDAVAMTTEVRLGRGIAASYSDIVEQDKVRH